jgi:hypothetical protein
MFPTCSKIDFAGRKALSATLLTINLLTDPVPNPGLE